VELKAREQAEQVVRDSEGSLRRLTGRLLQLQDAERRKFSRELHDSLGQYLAGVKMNLEMFATQREDNLLAERFNFWTNSWLKHGLFRIYCTRRFWTKRAFPRRRNSI
jgi:nitrate/nitrite-specific signal transduction histidine kinase